ncbi:MAG: hypothetical protein U0457_15435 [Candidatus Sericytochromatia bacterium]
MSKKIQYLIIDSLIKGILFFCIRILLITLNIFEILIFILIQILITILSSIITQKVLNYNNKKFKENFYLIYISNLISIILMQLINELYTKFIFIPFILNNNHKNMIITYTEFRVEETNYYNIIGILLINLLISIICASIISFYKIIKNKDSKK